MSSYIVSIRSPSYIVMVRSKKPTTTELEILDVLWEMERATVREIYEAVNKRRPMSYTTVLKFMQIMLEKKLVLRDETDRAHIYRPAQTQKQTQKNLVA